MKFARKPEESNHSLMERAIGTAVASIIYNEFRDEIREAQICVRIKRHVKMAEAVKKEVEKQ